MTNRVKQIVASLAMVAICAAGTLAQGRSQDPLARLKRAIGQASAPALSTAQEVALRRLINEYVEALPFEDDEVEEAAEDAFEAAILAGDFAAAQVHATTYANREAQLEYLRKEAIARLGIGSIEVLRNGGQFNPLVRRFGRDRLLELVRFKDARGEYWGGPGGGRW